MFGLKTKNYGKIEETVKVPTEKEIKKIKEEENRKLEIKEFNAIRSICLDCKNAFVTHYIPNPHNPDPMDVVCKIKMGAASSSKYGSSYFLGNNLGECVGDRWNRKTVNCSDFCKRKS